VDTGEGGRGREGEGEASEGEKARADEGARGQWLTWQTTTAATKAGVGRRGGAAA